MPIRGPRFSPASEEGAKERTDHDAEPPRPRRRAFPSIAHFAQESTRPPRGVSGSPEETSHAPTIARLPHVDRGVRAPRPRRAPAAPLLPARLGDAAAMLGAALRCDRDR